MSDQDDSNRDDELVQLDVSEDMPDLEHVGYRLDGEVAVITVDRQEALNALNQDVLLELSLAFEMAEANADVRALVVTGAGRAFVAGADIAGMQELTDAFSGRELSLLGQDVFGGLAALPFPTVAAINGFALGGGLELALAADLRVASPAAKLGLPEVGLGLIPGYGGTQRLPRLIGQGRALDLIMTGRHVGADEALQLGLVNRVADDALAGALELAHTAARNSPIAIGLAKEAVVRGLDVTLSQGLEIEADLFGLAATSSDMREGTAAFLEKRSPVFTGR
ncbi:MAG TPA: enoyl-CoA hydratase-related protein [Trueperaceae bacterium]|nr:enoyl-CoA hydratase-related protein [Trueperaceae bacterium]